MKWLHGHVQWWDRSSGEGVVVGDNGLSYYCHWSTILHGERGSKNLTDGARVRFTLYTNLYSSRVEAVEEVAA